ncbi:MAG: hypothetical protein HYS17_01035 [Micavibrio aeruginosavorus]|uniref:DUF6782 domain-containing protein n=1 Tax=Micavibrio aeruginosavorus TaxID=349221 RepID=A0A7T5UI81_9BACT|nr:MAG: hypothetical protein HYS17_01035 [Micavibrio aeruginosavorus]
MKADDRLNRKNHGRRSHRADSEVPDVDIYDLTLPDEACFEPVLLSAVALPARLDYDSILAQPFSFEAHEDIGAWLAAILADSPTASRLWVEAERAGWQVGFADLKNSGSLIDIPSQTVLLDTYALSASALGRSPYFRNELLICFVRALRDIWHEQRYQALEDEFMPESLLMIERVRSADCDTAALLVGWELRGAGYTDVWRHLIGAEEGDMALVFTRFLERDPSALFDGSALAYAFRQWYADESRVDGCDHDTLEAMDDILLSYDGKVRPFGERRASVADIEALTTLPDGRCYLRGLAETILRDPFFAGLHDPVNQTHLFHLMYDMEVVMVNNVPFRDARLARLIFPGADHSRVR